MVDAQTRASFHPIMQERIMAVVIVAIRFSMAPSVAPLIPARSLAPLEREELSAPTEWMS
jgi:hypothetical protein